ncbi:hypothetical protein H1235_03440 [Pseudoxanthomonas sp. NC8]|nr:hypothetical protein H1235_03440 [Pseudoxanthomonas sp. NC8]
MGPSAHRGFEARYRQPRRGDLLPGRQRGEIHLSVLAIGTRDHPFVSAEQALLAKLAAISDQATAR